MLLYKRKIFIELYILSIQHQDRAEEEGKISPERRQILALAPFYSLQHMLHSSPSDIEVEPPSLSSKRPVLQRAAEPQSPPLLPAWTRLRP